MTIASEILSAVALPLAGVSAFGAIAAWFGAFFEPLDLLSHAAPAWFVSAFAAGSIALLAGGSALVMALAAAAMLVSGAMMAPEIVARMSARPATLGRQTLRLVQYNVWDHNPDQEATVGWLQAQDADILVLEETADGAITAALSVDFPYSVVRKDGSPSPTTILSRKAPNSLGTIDFAGLRPRHGGVWAQFGEGSHTFVVAGVHYRHPLPFGALATQSEAFAKALEPFDQSSLIVAGDFNLTPWSFALRRQDARLGLQRLTRAMPTWPSRRMPRWRGTVPFPLLPIDHVYVGRDWQLVELARGPDTGSDHRAIVVTLTRS